MPRMPFLYGLLFALHTPIKSPSVLGLFEATNTNGVSMQSKSGALTVDGRFAASMPRRFAEPIYVASWAVAHPFAAKACIAFARPSMTPIRAARSLASTCAA